MIREATEDDLLDLLYLAKEFSKESPDFWKFSKDKTEASLLSGINGDSTQFYVYEDEGDILGFICGSIISIYLSEDKIAAVLAWYVKKDKRGTRIPLALFDSFLEWAEATGATTVTAADQHNIADLSSLYEKKGFTLTEKTYAKRIN